ncbi:hypothetical protein QQG55_3105 [Brugia pahangi]
MTDNDTSRGDNPCLPILRNRLQQVLHQSTVRASLCSQVLRSWFHPEIVHHLGQQNLVEKYIVLDISPVSIY